MLADFRNTSVLRVIHLCRALTSLSSHLVDVRTSRQFNRRGTQVGVTGRHSFVYKLSHYRSGQTLRAPGD